MDLITGSYESNIRSFKENFKFYYTDVLTKMYTLFSPCILEQRGVTCPINIH